MDQLERRRKTNKQGRKIRGKALLCPKSKPRKTSWQLQRRKRRKKEKKFKEKKALDERDLNILGQMSQLNRSIVVVDEPRRETEEKEKELERKRAELERKEKEIQRKEQERELEEMRRIVQGPSREDEDDEYDGENFDLDDNGQDLAGEIDVAQAASFIANSEKSQPSNEWPSVGMKRPRAHAHQRASMANKCPRRQNGPSCADCLHLQAELEELREANKLLTEQLSQCRDRGGSQCSAE